MSVRIVPFVLLKYSRIHFGQAVLYRNFLVPTFLHRQFSESLPSVPLKSTELVPHGNEITYSGRELQKSALDECTEDVSHYAPYQVPSYNLAAFVNKSEYLQKLVDLGVALYKLEKQPAICEEILKRKFDDIKPYLQFFLDLGINAEELGPLISKTPSIILQDLDKLHVRINYLESKNFTEDDMKRIVLNNPVWLTLPVQEIDEKLGYFQEKFKLSGNEVRFVTVRRPKLITYDKKYIESACFTIKEELGFNDSESKSLLLKKPKIYTTNPKSVAERFDYLHKKMKISHDKMIEEPVCLLHRLNRIRPRHEYLVSLDKAQYDGTKPGYVSLTAMLSCDDVSFCRDVAGTSVTTYNLFLKTL